VYRHQIDSCDRGIRRFGGIKVFKAIAKAHEGFLGYACFNQFEYLKKASTVCHTLGAEARSYLFRPFKGHPHFLYYPGQGIPAETL